MLCTNLFITILTASTTSRHDKTVGSRAEGKEIYFGANYSSRREFAKYFVWQEPPSESGHGLVVGGRGQASLWSLPWLQTERLL